MNAVSRTINGPTITIHCTACGGRNVAATSYNYGEAAALFHVVRLSPYTSTNFVRCMNCGERSVTPIAMDELSRYSSDELFGLSTAKGLTGCTVFRRGGAGGSLYASWVGT